MGKVARIYIGNDTWAELVGLQGPQGNQGIQGIQGEKGDTGLTGPKVAVYSDEPPANPEHGDVWFDADATVSPYGSVATLSPTAPPNPSLNEMWVDTTTYVMRYWNGAAWIIVNAAWYSSVANACTSLTGWTVRSGTWAISEGVIRQSDMSAAAYRIQLDAPAFISNYAAAEVEVKMTAGSGSIQRAALFCAWDGSTTTTGTWLGLVNASGGSWQLYHEKDTQVAGTATNVTAAYGTWYKIGIVNRNGVTYGYFNGQYVNSWTAATVPGPSLNRTGLYTYGADVSFRNLKTWKPSSDLAPWEQ